MKLPAKAAPVHFLKTIADNHLQEERKFITYSRVRSYFSVLYADDNDIVEAESDFNT